jgi:hypothetical protein
LKVIFSLEKKGEKEKLYERMYDLLPFQGEVMENKEVSFFYSLKDLAAEIEEKLIPKINKSKEGNALEDVDFRVIYNDKEIFSYGIDTQGLTDESFAANEIEVFYFFESIVKKFEQKVMEEHKRLVLYKSE